MARPRGTSTQTVTPLREGWRVSLTAPGALSDPTDLDRLSGPPLAGTAPGTVASALRDAGRSVWDLQGLDGQDSWYRCRFPASALGRGETAHLVFEGLATLADVWLNGRHLLRSENMLLRHEVDVTGAFQPENELCLRFAALDAFLAQKRPRGRWKTRLVDHPQLRWVRTCLLGRMPGWSPPVHAVGPWRPVSLVVDRLARVERADLRAEVAGDEGRVEARLSVRALGGPLTGAELWVGESREELVVETAGAGEYSVAGTLRLPQVERWWPHTHGPQPLYPVRVRLRLGDRSMDVDFGRTGFRELKVDRSDGGFGLVVNGVPVFARGASWMPLDVATLGAPDAAYDRSLRRFREAGMNLLRVPGTGCYETDAFYDRCAELGILVWQDFAFANMDYPADDPAFRASAAAEAEQLLDRLQLSPALAVVCGGSEVQQQAAMLGLERESWQSPLFDEILPEAVTRARPDVAYVPSSPSGGPLPFHVDQGIAHYYGVGAYLRPLEDARRSGVRFAAECLAFANVPERPSLEVFLRDGEMPGHHPAWKAGVPRDVGAGWDFDDVRDHYVQLLFGEDPARVRAVEPERYLALGRAAVGEVMAATFAEWRRPGSSCRGALVWFWNDLRPGAGWGLLDVYQRPKSPYYYLKRALSPVALLLSDEGLNGLRLHIVNEHPFQLEGELQLALYRSGGARVFERALRVSVPPRGVLQESVDGLVGRFLDTAYAYRFGPPSHDVTLATLHAADGTELARAFHFPAGLRFPRSADLGLEAEAVPSGEGAFIATVTSGRFAQAVSFEVPGYEPEDNYFHLEPGGRRRVLLLPERPGSRPPSGEVSALNAAAPVRLRVRREENPFGSTG